VSVASNYGFSPTEVNDVRRLVEDNCDFLIELILGFMATAEVEMQAPQAVRRWADDPRVYVELVDERTISFPASKFPRLATASPEMLKQVSLRVGGRALRWEALDQDIWIGDVLAGRFPK
jgi:hypothetical protein